MSRGRSLELLLDVALQDREMQLILLTPQVHLRILCPFLIGLVLRFIGKKCVPKHVQRTFARGRFMQVCCKASYFI